jgi:hypothetical protein
VINVGVVVMPAVGYFCEIIQWSGPTMGPSQRPRRLFRRRLSLESSYVRYVKIKLQVLTLCRSLIVESWNRSVWPKGKRQCLRHLAQEGGLKPTVQINVESKDPRENFRLFQSPGDKINSQREQSEKGGSNVPGYSVWDSKATKETRQSFHGDSKDRDHQRTN